MWCCMSAQHQGVGVGGGAEGNLWFENEQNIWFRRLFILTKGELCTCILYVWMVDTLGGGGGGSFQEEANTLSISELLCSLHDFYEG